MIGVIVAAHGTLAEALVDTALLVMREASQIVAVSILAKDDARSFETRLRESVASLQADNQGVLLLTDMFGGSPSNIGMTLHAEGKVEILTGVNLPMLIKVLQSRQRSLSLKEVAHEGRVSATRSIAIASEVLAGDGALTEAHA